MMAEPVPFEAVNQRGVFTRRQAYDDGWTPRQVKRRLASARWRVVAGAALAAADLEIGPWPLAHAVRLTWPAAVVSHELAGVLWGFPIDHRGVGTASVRRQQGLTAQGLRATRRDLTAADVGRLGGLPVTTEHRTAVDLLAGLPWVEARNLWAWLTTRQRIGLADLDTAVRARHGLAGTPQLRRLLRASATGSLSAAEDLLHELLRRGGLIGWVANRPMTVGGRTVVPDVLFARERVVVEVDGFEHHGDRRAFQSDRTRQNALVAAGYVVLRFTWADLADRPAYVVGTIRAALAGAR